MLPPIPVDAFELTLEQSLELRVMTDSVSRIDKSTLEKMVLDAMRLNMIHRNLLKKIGKGDEC